MSQTLMIKASLSHTKADLDALTRQLKEKYPQIDSVRYWFDPEEKVDISTDWLRKTVEVGS